MLSDRVMVLNICSWVLVRGWRASACTPGDAVANCGWGWGWGGCAVPLSRASRNL
jgi:hypothetical protein